ncbi:hypothetical protein VXS72_15890 [Acinetobacter pittii]|uniref:hypothetical protein n=1 Tax=Acinetobacter pittii TaxID=48296 RepID=UPI002E185A9A|nr:hypothetical protein [Acinetobacter pittii]
MTDLNKERELEAQIETFKKEAMELWFVPNLADTYKNKDLFSYSIMDGEVFFMREQARQLWSFWNKAKAQAVPDSSYGVILNCEQLREALEFGAPDLKIETNEFSDEQMGTELAIIYQENGHSGEGFYTYYVECPDEGSIKLGESESGAEG